MKKIIGPILTGAVALVFALCVATDHHARLNTAALQVFDCSHAEGGNGKDLLKVAK
jgi:hypothetical protein